MFLHIGSDMNVAYDEIIAVINIEKENKINSDFINNLAEKNDCTVFGNKILRSAIIYCRDNETKAYLSPVSTASVKKRIADFEKIKFADGKFDCKFEN